MALVAVTNRIPAEGLAALRAEHEVRAWEHEECIPRDEALRLVAVPTPSSRCSPSGSTASSSTPQARS
jgi:hypothetical protein